MLFVDFQNIVRVIREHVNRHRVFLDRIIMRPASAEQLLRYGKAAEYFGDLREDQQQNGLIAARARVRLTQYTRTISRRPSTSSSHF